MSSQTKTALPSRDKSRQHILYERVAKAIHYLDQHFLEQPSLAELARAVGISESRLQRNFLDWAGVTPKQFLQYLTLDHAREKLRQAPVLDSALASGLSGSGRLHDLLLRWDSVTPGEYRSLGAGLQIEYGIHSSPLGYCLLATSHRGICKLAFFDSENERSQLLEELHKDWTKASISENPGATARLIACIFQTEEPQNQATNNDLRLLLKGSPFRLQVWQALLRIPEGRLCSYQQVADAMGKPAAVRAVASAIANNPVGLLIPCHRVIRSTGAFNQYRWGKGRKQALVAYEEAQSVLVQD